MTKLEETIDSSVGEVRTDSLDISYGEIVNLHSNGELVIDPEYQRLFRWSLEQRSKLIESILLELPIPQIFVIENEDGVLELIDGLQRISSVIQFIDSDQIDHDPLELVGCDLIKELNGFVFDDLPLRLRLRIKRAAVRMVIIKRESESFLRYEMFQRLNTGGELLSHQELRNCSARMVGESGDKFYNFLKDCASYNSFNTCIEPLSDAEFEKKGDEELVLRYFALKNGQDLFRGSIRDWLNDYMEATLLNNRDFNYNEEKKTFEELFDFIAASLGAGAFVKYRDDRPVGGLAPAYYEAVTMGVFSMLPELTAQHYEAVKEAIIRTVQDDDFREVTGPGANAQWKLERRIEIVEEALQESVSE
jgi:hypothetical protein